jgi:hypothetical protein
MIGLSGELVSGQDRAFVDGSGGLLHRQAQARGGRFEGTVEFEAPVVAGTIQELMAHAPLTLVGRVLLVRSRLAPNGKSLATTATLRVHDVIRGDVRPGSLIDLVTPGGAHSFKDGTSVILRVPDYVPPSVGRTYVLLLQPLADGGSGRAAYRLAVGAEGQFELEAAPGVVWPAQRELRDPIFIRYRGMRISDFLAELRATTK